MAQNISVAGKVLQGTCGWSDFKLPNGSSKADPDRLTQYARFFPCVEVDTSSYAIPKPDSTAKWAKSVLPICPGFKFHFKAFGLFCHQSSPINSLPWQARQVLQSAGLLPTSRTTMPLSDMPPACEQACWDAFHAALEPVVKAGAMGCVVFQFQLNFSPGQRNREYVERCRRMLRSDVVMAVEFRNRAWFQDQPAMSELSSWCASLGLCLIAADELRHETFQRDRAQQGLAPGQVWEVMPMSLAVTRPDMVVVRLHRRHGTTDRWLTAEEHQAWSQRLSSIAPSVSGPIYFLWGTDWEDAPVVNSRALAAALPPALRYDHEGITAKAMAGKPGTITAMFSRSKALAGRDQGAAGSSQLATSENNQPADRPSSGRSQFAAGTAGSSQPESDAGKGSGQPALQEGGEVAGTSGQPELHGSRQPSLNTGNSSGRTTLEVGGSSKGIAGESSWDGRLAAVPANSNNQRVAEVCGIEERQRLGKRSAIPEPGYAGSTYASAPDLPDNKRQATGTGLAGDGGDHNVAVTSWVPAAAIQGVQGTGVQGADVHQAQVPRMEVLGTEAQAGIVLLPADSPLSDGARQDAVPEGKTSNPMYVEHATGAASHVLPAGVKPQGDGPTQGPVPAHEPWSDVHDAEQLQGQALHAQGLAMHEEGPSVPVQGGYATGKALHAPMIIGQPPSTSKAGRQAVSKKAGAKALGSGGKTRDIRCFFNAQG